MKKVLLATITMLSMNSLASYVLMAGIAEARWPHDNNATDAMVYDGNAVVTLEQFFGGSLENAAFRVQLVEYGTFLDAYWYDDENNRMVASDGAWGVGAGGSGDGYSYTHTAQFDVPDSLPMETLVAMELGEYDEQDDFIQLAISDVYTLGDLKDVHTYEVASLYPLKGKDWAPPMFYVYNIPIPEPTAALLLVIGLCTMLSMKRHEATS